MLQEQFSDILQLIKQSRSKAIAAVNTEMINLYWNIGQYIYIRLENQQWGQSVVTELAQFLKNTEPEIKGFSDKNLWRMKQFYQAYKDLPKLSALLREISWTNNLIILSRTKSTEEREFYLRLSRQEKFSSRELERQINSGVFERTILGNTKLSSAMRELHPDIANTFKDSYIFDFLNLSDSFSENDLQKGLLSQMRDFILELGKDFLFIAEEYKVQVGYSDFFIDLLFYHRALQCLIAFELKSDKFKPEHLGQLNFYLEALDGMFANHMKTQVSEYCYARDQDHAVVEYALSRSLSPTMVAQYKIQLPDKKMLVKKLSDLSESQ